MAAAQETSTTRRRRRTVTKTDVNPPSAARRSRGVRQPTEALLADLDRMISALIKENRALHRQIDKLSRQAGGATAGPAARALQSIQRRLSNAVESGTTTRRRRSASPARRTRGKITDPEMLERRRQALAKARAARATKLTNA
jgi:hypothetical protein